MACGTLAQRGGEQATEGQTANQSGQSKTHACRVVGLMRVETAQNAYALGIKPRFQSLPKIAHSTSRDFGERMPNYKGKGRPFGVGKTLGDVSVPLT